MKPADYLMYLLLGLGGALGAAFLIIYMALVLPVIVATLGVLALLRKWGGQ